MRRSSTISRQSFNRSDESRNGNDTFQPHRQRQGRRRKRKPVSSPFTLFSKPAVILASLVVCGLLFYYWKDRPMGRSDRNSSIRGTIMDKAAASRYPPRTTTSTEQIPAHGFQKYSHAAPPCTDLISDQVAFTLVTQLSEDRLWMLPHHCRRWGSASPMSVTVLVHNNDTTYSTLWETLNKQGCHMDQMILQLVAASDYPPDDYPVNILRTRALSLVQTSHVVYVDIDFWESTSLHDTLLGTHAIRQALAEDTKLALVLPAFQLNRQCREYKDCRQSNVRAMPHTVQDLMSLMKEHNVAPFDPTNRGGHGSTRYKEWLGQSPGDLLEIPCVLSNRYEPYLVFRYCHDLPPFQEQFSGYGKNKMTMVMHMRRRGYTFRQIGGAFVVHYPHLDSHSRMHWNEGPKELVQRTKSGKWHKRNPSELTNVDWSVYKRGRVDALFVEFRKWLVQEVSDEERVAMCPDAQDDDSKLWIDRGK